ncbi:hypothetical protein BV22DRAFT_1022192, partial [Leucogyrophana mollusca]
ITYELISVDLTKSKRKAPSFTAYQRSRQVPYIGHDGFILYESCAIERCPAKKYADQGTPNLVPIEPEPGALFEQAALSSFPFSYGCCCSTSNDVVVWDSLYSQQTDGARIAELAATRDAKLDGYEAILGKQKCLAGDNLTLAGLFRLPAWSTPVGPAGYAHLLDKRPNVTRWWNNISSRPARLAVKDGA